MDPITIGIIIAGLIGSGIGLIQQNWGQGFSANEAEKGRDFSANQAQLDRDFNAQQAQMARDFSERMSSTAFQRQVTDMKNAGLNPALMAGGAGGAAAPGGVALSAGGSTMSPTASGVGFPNAGAPFSNAISSAMAATIESNSRDYATNVRLELAKARELDNASKTSATQAEQARKAQLAIDKAKAERAQMIAQYKATH